jgi:hypothetical protein
MIFKDLDTIVCRLSLSEQTKQFVYAIYELQSKAVVYVLATHNLSKRLVTEAVFFFFFFSLSTTHLFNYQMIDICTHTYIYIYTLLA